MKKLIFVLLIITGCNKTTKKEMLPIIDSSLSWPKPTPYGSLISDTFSNGNDWTVTSPASAFSFNGTDMLLNKAVGGGYNLNDYALNTGYGGSCLENWTIDCYFKVTEKSASCNGFFIGVKSTAAFGGTNHHIVQFNTNSGSGKIAFYLAGATSATVTSAGALTFAVNDECRLVLSRTADSINGHVYSATVYNLTNPNNISLSYTFSESYPITIGTPPTSQFAVYSGVGTLTIHSFDVSTTMYKNANFMVVGNSISKGLYSLAYSARWATTIFAGSSKLNYVCGGPGDRTTNILERINEIKNFNARYLILAFGGNDLEAGVAIGTVQANYLNIYNQLVKRGRVIYHCKPTPRDLYDFTTWNAWLDSNFSNVIDTWTPLKGVGTDLGAAYDAGDGVHPNATGHTAISNAVRPIIISKL